MFARMFLVTSLLLASIAGASAADRKVWYEKGYDGPVPTTLLAAIAAKKDFLGASNPYWKPVTAPGLRKVCAALKAVKLTCDYNTRITVSMFLTVNGKGLFPASGGTNPYFTERSADDVFPDDGFIGHPPQNDMLAAAILKNVKLFKNDDLTAEAVQKFWR